MNEIAKPETWGELGPAMKVLNERQREFVRHLVTGKPGYGALTRAYKRVGYGKNSKAATLSKEAHHMSRDERVIAAVRTRDAAAFSALMNRGRAYFDVRAQARAS